MAPKIGSGFDYYLGRPKSDLDSIIALEIQRRTLGLVPKFFATTLRNYHTVNVDLCRVLSTCGLQLNLLSRVVFRYLTSSDRLKGIPVIIGALKPFFVLFVNNINDLQLTLLPRVIFNLCDRLKGISIIVGAPKP